MKTRKWLKRLSLLLCIALFFGLFPVISFAEEGDDLSRWLLSNAYYDNSKGCFILTEDYTTWTTGAVVYNTACPDDFSLEMDYYTGSSNREYGGADGIAVAFYANYTYSDTFGEELGFDGSEGYGIELDTYCNENREDPSYNHIALIKESVGNHLVTKPLPESEDEQWHHLRIVVKNQTCSAYVDNQLKLSHKVEPTGFGWIVITAATGAGVNLHAVKNIHISKDTESTQEPLLFSVDLTSKMIATQYTIDGKVHDGYEYQIKAMVNNNANDSANNVTVHLELPEELTAFNSIELSKDLGDIQPGESAQAEWSVYADWPQSSHVVIYRTTTTVNQATSLQQENYIYLQTRNKADNTFIFGTDQWAFINSGKYFTDGKTIIINGKPVYEERYYLNETDYQTLLANCSDLEKDMIVKDRFRHWNGSCYGMSAIAILTKIGILDANKIQDGKNNLHAVTMSNNSNIESFINFYHLQTNLVPVLNDFFLFLQKSTVEQLAEIERKAEAVATGGVPILLCFSGDEDAHAVVAYGVEHGKFTIKDGWFGSSTQYDSKILIYDCNSPTSKEDHCLYYNTGTDQWCIPAYSWATKLTKASTEIDILNAVYYPSAVANYRAQLISSAGTQNHFQLRTSDGVFAINASTDDREHGVVSYYMPNMMEDGSFSSGELLVTLPETAENYTIIPDHNASCDFLLVNGDTSAAIQCDQADQITISTEGALTAERLSGDYALSLVSDSRKLNPSWYKTTVSGRNSDMISLTPTTDGIILAASDLSAVQISISNDTQSKTAYLSTKENEVLLTIADVGSGQAIEVFADKDGNGTYECLLDKEVSFFKDVKNGAWYHDAVQWAVLNGVTSGTGDGKFSPNATCTREQIVTFLWKAFGAPEPQSYDNPFKDVKKSKYYYKAVLWAAENGITKGIGDGKFGVGKGCTREQAMTFLWVAAGKPGHSQQESAFTDVKKGKYYYNAILWAVENGITSGVGNGKFGVGQTCTRAQIVTFLYALLGK